MSWVDIEVTPKVANSRMIKLQVAHLIAHGGHTNHSELGLTMKAIIHGLEAAGCPYRIKAHPGVGYIIVVPPIEERIIWARNQSTASSSSATAAEPNSKS